MATILPVIVEDLISKVTNEKLHYEQRQHYAKTLEDIRNEADTALKKYELHRKAK